MSKQVAKLFRVKDSKIENLVRRMEALENNSTHQVDAGSDIFPPLTNNNVWQMMGSRAVKAAGIAKMKLPIQQIDVLNSAVAEQTERE